MVNARDRLSAFMLGQIKAGTEMPALATQDDGAHTFRRVGKKCIKRVDQRIIHRIALFGTIENNGRNVAVKFNACDRRIAGRRLHHFLR